MKSLDAKLAEVRANRTSRAFIIADAKDADMAFGISATGRAVDGRHPSLEDVFLKLTGRAIRDTEMDDKDQMKQMLAMRRRGR